MSKLNDLFLPVRYFEFAVAVHEITRAGDNRQRMDQMLRIYEFFQRYIATKLE